MTNVLSTKDYTIFKRVKGNRVVQEKKVLALIESIQHKNLMQDRPILVDSDITVIDGQHRLEACKRLTLEVFYQITTTCSLEDIIKINSRQSSWSVGDYINYYSENGNPHYKLLLEAHIKTGLSWNSLFKLLGAGGESKHLGKRIDCYNRIKTGLFVSNKSLFIVSEKAEYIGRTCYLIKTHSNIKSERITSSKLRDALVELSNKEGFDEEHFLQRLEMLCGRIKPCATMEEYLQVFIVVYNHAMHKNKRIKQEEF